MKNLLILFTAFLMSCGNNDDWKIGNTVYKFENITKNFYVIHGPLNEPNELNEGFINNPALIVGKKSLVVIDPTGSYQSGKKFLKEVEKISKLPIKAIFNTHLHGDHWLGNHAIVEKYPDVKIYAHPEMIKQAKNGGGDNWVDLMERLTKGATKGTQAIYPEYEVKHKDIIKIDEMSFIIHKPTPKAHSDNDIMIEYPEHKIMFASDYLFNNRLGQFDASSNILQNIDALKYLSQLDIKTFISGHGPSGDITIVETYLNYLKILTEEAQKAYEEGLEGYEVKDKVVKKLADYKSWHLFDVNIGRHLAKAILDVEAMDF
jgi:glyoxylase-like metal-dependent hydrolase (beta-lactamase superfamily II)